MVVPARRVLVVGAPGTGKSTAARELSAKTTLPVIHLDRLLWQTGWVQRDRAAFDALLGEALDRPAWIIEGNYVRTLPQRLRVADLVIWLDLPRRIYMARVIGRTVRHFRRTRPDMTPGCPERFDLEFLSYIWSFGVEERPNIISAIETHGKHCHLVHLTSPREIKRYLASFT